MIASTGPRRVVRRRVLVYGALALATVTSLAFLLMGRGRLGPDLRRLAKRAAAQYGLAPELVRAVVRTESGGNPRAVSRANAYGLMQLTQGTAVELAGESLTVEQIMEPERNLDLGCKYLRRLLDRYGDLRLALMAYNAGPGRVDRWRRENPHLGPEELVREAAYKETRNFVRRVLFSMKGA